MKGHTLGFTLVEMVTVIVITGIIGSIVAVFMRAPVQGYVDSARRAELTDIADTAYRRMTRELRLALPNSVRISVVGGISYLEFIPTTGGGRYRDAVDAAGLGNILNFAAADTSFEVLGAMPAVAAGDQIVVYNLGIAGADAYAGNTLATHNRRAVSGVAGNVISISSVNRLPHDSCIYDDAGFVAGGCRFQVVQTPVSYVCDPAVGTLMRWQGYPVAAAQPIALPAGGTAALLANNVSACTFTYDANVVAQRAGLVTIALAIGRDGESVSLYGAAHVSNLP